MEKTVLVHEWVTGGGLAGSELPPSWATEGSAMRRAIAADFACLPELHVIMTLDDRLSPDPGPWTIARIGPGEEVEKVSRLGAEADWTVLIAPESRGILADRTRMLERAGGRSIGSSAEAIELAGDKLRLGALWRERGIRTPDCRLVIPAESLPDDVAYPAVLKPIDGAGAVDTFFIAEASAIPAGARTLGSSLLQPFVPGAALSASFLVDPAGRARLIAVGRQRIEVRGSRFVYLGGTLPVPEPYDGDMLLRAIETVPGLRGFVGVDFVRNEEAEPVFLEINPRPTTSYVGLARILPQGLLAWSWLATAEGNAGRIASPGDLAEMVGSRGAVTFDADGRICVREGAPL